MFQATTNINGRLNTINSQAMISIRQVFIRSENTKGAKDANSKFLESTRMAARMNVTLNLVGVRLVEYGNPSKYSLDLFGSIRQNLDFSMGYSESKEDFFFSP
jgi:hypothetical protein